MDKRGAKEMLGKQMQLLSERSEVLSQNDSEGLVKLTEAMCSVASGNSHRSNEF